MENNQTENSVRVITCVYCGHEYESGTQSHGQAVLTEHIKICAKHPMRKCEADKELLRNTLGRIARIRNLDVPALDQLVKQLDEITPNSLKKKDAHEAIMEVIRVLKETA